MTDEQVTVKPRDIIDDGNGKFIFSRSGWSNMGDIVECAVLAFHKALIGVSELSLVEEMEEHTHSLRMCQAVMTYYAVYHLFTCAMLLDSHYEIKLDDLEYYKNKKKVNDPSELPGQWNDSKKLEQDLASSIGHADIKRYCKQMRKLVDKGIKLTNRNKVLYKSYVIDELDKENHCIPGLYEKLAYVRDRAIYRPTYILFDDGNPAQTSKDVRKEINSLPKSSFIYNTIMQFFKAALMDKNDEVVEDFLHILTHVGMQQVNCRSKIVKRYSYDWQTIESMGGSEKGQSAPNFICQMIELFEQDDTVRFYKKYWEPILSYKE